MSLTVLVIGYLFWNSCLSWGGVQADSKPFNLAESIEYAIGHSPSIDSASKTLSMRGLQYRSSVSGLLPSLDLNLTHGLQNNIPISQNYGLVTPNSTAPWYSSLSLGVTESLYDNGVTLIQMSIADRGQEVATILYEKAKASLALSVATEFYNYSLENALVEVRQRQLEILLKQFDLLSSQYQQGLKPRLDFLRFKAQVQRAEIDRTNAEKSREQSATNLRKILGVSIDGVEAVRFEPVQVSNVELEKLLPERATLIDNTYDYRVSKIQRQINDSNVTLSKRKYWPQVNLAGGLSYSNVNYINSGQGFSAGNQLSYSALLSIQYNIWDWGIRRRDVEVAQFTRDIQDNDLNLNLLDVKLQIDATMIDLSRVRKNSALNRALLESEQQNYLNVEVEYHEGKVTYIDLITSLANLLDAKVQYYSVYFETYQVLAKYRYYEGTVYEKLSQRTSE